MEIRNSPVSPSGFKRSPRASPNNLSDLANITDGISKISIPNGPPLESPNPLTNRKIVRVPPQIGLSLDKPSPFGEPGEVPSPSQKRPNTEDQEATKERKV
ncbi:MAG: hypothetical protein V4489_06820 [Chlamydiota bacterium]